MSITYEMDLSNSNARSFSELVAAIMKQTMEIGPEILRRVLEKRDAELLTERNKARFRCKGLQKTGLKTRPGILDFSRRVCEDKSVTDGVRRVCLPDKELNIEKIGLTEKALCEEAALLCCAASCRDAAEIFSSNCGVSVSAMGIWNIVQAPGEKETERVERYAKLAEQNVGSGTVAAPVLYEENDGVWLK